MYLGIVESTKTGLAAELEKMKAKAVEFTRAYDTLTKTEPDKSKYPREWQKWNELKSYGDKTRATIKRITSTIDTAGNVIDSITYGVTHPFGLDPFGLGILPILPAAGVAISGAVIASSIAAMTYFISSAYEYGKFADSTPEVRAELMKRAQSTGIGAGLANVKTIMIIGALIMFAPKIIEMINKRKK